MKDTCPHMVRCACEARCIPPHTQCSRCRPKAKQARKPEDAAKRRAWNAAQTERARKAGLPSGWEAA